MAGAGVAGVAGAACAASSDGFNATTADSGVGGGAVSPGRSARKGVFAGGAPAAALVLGGASAFGLASGAIAPVVRRGVGAGDTDGVGAGPVAAGWSPRSCCKRPTSVVTAGSGAGACAGTSTTRRSGPSIRRSSQGKPKGQSPSPPKVRVNSSVWISSESSSASVSGLRSTLVRWVSCWPAACGDPSGVGSEGGVASSLEPVELKRAPPSLSGHGCWRGAR
jgi:hypothetical protein